LGNPEEYKSRAGDHGTGFWFLVITDKQTYKEKNLREARIRCQVLREKGIKVRRVYNEFEQCTVRM